MWPTCVEWDSYSVIPYGHDNVWTIGTEKSKQLLCSLLLSCKSWDNSLGQTGHLYIMIYQYMFYFILLRVLSSMSSNTATQYSNLHCCKLVEFDQQGLFAAINSDSCNDWNTFGLNILYINLSNWTVYNNKYDIMIYTLPWIIIVWGTVQYLIQSSCNPPTKQHLHQISIYRLYRLIVLCHGCRFWEYFVPLRLCYRIWHLKVTPLISCVVCILWCVLLHYHMYTTVNQYDRL